VATQRALVAGGERALRDEHADARRRRVLLEKLLEQRVVLLVEPRRGSARPPRRAGRAPRRERGGGVVELRGERRNRVLVVGAQRELGAIHGDGGELRRQQARAAACLRWRCAWKTSEASRSASKLLAATV
jgi:hypothetical protein